VQKLHKDVHPRVNKNKYILDIKRYLYYAMLINGLKEGM